MTFLGLQARLVSLIRARIRNGGLTERSFARTVGVSQPHLHNVLKGARTLSPEMSDQILEVLGLTVLDLVEDSAWTAALTAPLPERPPRGRSRVPPAPFAAS